MAVSFSHESVLLCTEIYLVLQAEGEFILEWGTSASSPTMGSIIAMINDARLAIGKSTIGFINPTVCPVTPGTCNEL